MNSKNLSSLPVSLTSTMKGKRFTSRFYHRNPKFCAVVLVTLLFLFFMLKQEGDHHESFEHFRQEHWDLSHVGIKEYPIATNYSRKDWHDYKFMEYEAGRTGPGEKGAGVVLTDPKEIELNKNLTSIEGLPVVISDKISVQRSVPDTRPIECARKKYFTNLPLTSVIIIFNNEWLSILLRTIHSVYNRTPHELLKEIVLVDDASTKPELNESLEVYLKEHFDQRIKLVRLKTRHGLIRTRMEGAKVAKGEVLVFLDSHMEANVNWLPPLLEPIVISPTTVTTPTMDHISQQNFQYIGLGGSRGVYDDIMWFQWFPLRRVDQLMPDQPHQVPIMLGAGFAVRADYFRDLGMYDDGLMIWNGEQIELSLKLHLCGGNLLEVPCSKTSHTFRLHHRNHELPGIDVAARNFKRVGEVWMDDYKEVMYRADPWRFGHADPGDMTKAKIIKSKLRCKPFQHFLEQIAPEMYTRYYYQLHYPGSFSSGAIRSDANPKFCIDYMGIYNKPAQLYDCNDATLKNPGYTQNWMLTWHRKLKLRMKDDCLQDNLYLDFCHFRNGFDYQKWKYNIKTKQLISFGKDKFCLTADVKGGKMSANGLGVEDSLRMKPCNLNDVNQKWTWGHVNETALNMFDSIDYINNTFVGLVDSTSVQLSNNGNLGNVYGRNVSNS